MVGVIRIKVVKRSGGEFTDEEYKLFARRGTGYTPWRSPDLKRGGVNKIMVDDFSCKIRQDLYDWYKPIREAYALEAKKMIRKRLRNQTRADQLQEYKTLRNLRRLENELYEQAKNKPFKARPILDNR
jgi:hypothetical protein